MPLEVHPMQLLMPKEPLQTELVSIKAEIDRIIAATYNGAAVLGLTGKIQVGPFKSANDSIGICRTYI